MPTTQPPAPRAALTVEDVLEMLFYHWPPLAVRDALANPSWPSAPSPLGHAAAAKEEGQGGGEEQRRKGTDERRWVASSLSLRGRCATSLSAYATHVASLAYTTARVLVAPSTVAAAVARVFLQPTSLTASSRTGTGGSGEGHHATESAMADHWREVMRRLQKKVDTLVHALEAAQAGCPTREGGNSAGVGVKRLRAEEEEDDGPLRIGTASGSGGGDGGGLAAPGRLLSQTRQGGYDKDADDPTSPRRASAASFVCSRAAGRGGEGASPCEAVGQRSQQTVSPPFLPTSTCGSGSNGGAVTPSRHPAMLSHRQRDNGETMAVRQGSARSLREPSDAASDGKAAAEEEEEEDVTAVDRLWRSIPTPTAELRRQLHALRYETPLTPETLFSLIQNHFFLVPGSDVFLAPVPPNTIMEYNEVKSDSYHHVIFAPLSLMDVKVAVRESRRRFHQNTPSSQDAREASPLHHMPSAHSIPAPILGMSAGTTTASLPLSLCAADDRVLTVADLERTVWHIASNCAMFNAPESFYPQTGRAFAMGCTEALVRFCREQLQQMSHA